MMLALLFILMIYCEAAQAAPVVAWIASALVAVGVSAGIATFIATVVVYTAANLLINKAFAPKTRSKGSNPDRNMGLGSGESVNYYNSEAAQRLLVGHNRVGGMETIPPTLSGANGENLHKIITVAGHEVDSFGCAYYDNECIFMTIGGGADGIGAISSGKYNAVTYIRRYLGTSSQTTDSILDAVDSTVFSSAFRGRGIAYVALEFVYSQDVYKGVPAASFDVNGAKLYDPRKDSTQSGGSGSHRYTDSTTWEYSTNPALAISWYLMHPSGGLYDPSELNWSTFITAATACDALVEIPGTFAAFATGGNASIFGDVITKTGGTNGAWDASVRSTDSIQDGSIFAVAGDITSSMMFGLTTDPAADDSYSSIDNAIYFNAGTLGIYENGVSIGTYGSYTTSTVCEVRRAGAIVRYFKDGKLIHVASIASATDAVYFDSSLYTTGATMTINRQHRYNCNGLLYAAITPSDFISNMRMLIDSMLGKMIYANGIWSVYAGGWQTPTFTIQKTDWISGLSIKMDGGLDTRFNRAHAWYIDPKRNWQRVECEPRTNAAYRVNDGNRDLDKEFDQSMCTDEFETQRKAEFLLRSSRNQIIVTGTLPPRFQDLSMWDTGTLVFDDLDWSSKTFRIVAVDMNVDGSYTCAFQEEQDDDWTDMAASEYNAPSTVQLPAVNEPTATAPVSLSIAQTVNGTLMFSIGRPIVLPYGSTFQIIASPANALSLNSGSVVFDGDTITPIISRDFTGSPEYWYARVRTGSYYSGYYPSSYGTPFMILPKADNTFANRIVPDQQIDVGTPAYWTVSSLGGIDAQYVTSGGINNTGLIRISNPASTATFGTAISAFPHPSNAGSYGQLNTANISVYKIDIRARVNSFVSVSSLIPELQFMIRHATNSGTVISDIQYARPAYSIGRYSVGSWNDVTMYLADTRMVELSDPPIPAFRRLGVYVYDDTGRAWQVDLDTVNVQDMGFINQPYYNEVQLSATNDFRSQHMMSAYQFSSTGVTLRVTSSNAFNLAEKYKYEIGRSLFASKVESYSASRYFVTNIASHFFTLAGTYSLVNTITVAGGATGNYRIARINSYTMMVEGPGLS